MTQPITFFLIDDDEEDTMIFRDMVEECEIPIRFKNAENGKEALDLLRQSDGNLPDVIFLDLNMPGMDGKECLKELKQDDRLATLPVIMYTTSSHTRDIEDTLQAGAVGFITKPSDVRELRKIIETIAEHAPQNLEQALEMLGIPENSRR
jgi:CheY-like chemotaxis protein